jgi:restriction endonuclease Mrr
MLSLPVAVFPADDRLASAIAVVESALPAIASDVHNLKSQRDTLRDRFRNALRECDNIKGAFESRLNWLRTCQWRSMTGSYFEEFLAELFKQRGFQVEMTGKAGDQGVDLILSLDGLRIAVQAKGYTSGSVSNSAVQEAHAGMTHHRCHRAVVITNSRFTSGAIELAASVGCLLIDGDQIVDLINGKVKVT